MKEEKFALKKSIECGDTDLIYLVLLHMLSPKKNLSELQIISNIDKNKTARDLLILYAKQINHPMLENFMLDFEMFSDIASLRFSNVLSQIKSNKVEQETFQELKASQDFFNKSSDSFFSSQVKEQEKLLKIQMDLEKETKEQNAPQSFVGLSICDTVSKLISLGFNNKASEIADIFDLADKTFYHLKINSLGSAKKWLKKIVDIFFLFLYIFFFSGKR